MFTENYYNNKPVFIHNFILKHYRVVVLLSVSIKSYNKVVGI